MALLANTSVKVLIHNTSFDFYVGHDDFLLLNNVLKEYDDMK